MTQKAATLTVAAFLSIVTYDFLSFCWSLIQSMKLMLQIAVGVFLGSLASQLAIDAWHGHREAMVNAVEEKRRADREKSRIEQGERIRALLLQGREAKTTTPSRQPAPGFVPDDAQMPQR